MLVDLLTTAVGLRIGLIEANPVGVWILEGAGLWGMVALKAAAVTVTIVGSALIWRAFPDDEWARWSTVAIPTLAAIPWLLAALHNLRLLSSVVG